MRFEVKTDKNNFSEKFSSIVTLFLITFFSIVFINLSLNFSKIAKYYEVNYFCKLILIDKSPNNFKKLSKLTKQSSKQKIWELCRQI